MPAAFEYDRQYEPAAPIVPVGLSRAGQTDANRVVSALIDTGADASMIPVNSLRSIGARFVEQRSMRGVVGTSVTVNMYLITVQIGGHVLHGIRVVAAPAGSEAIIGRDVLNQLEVHLNGPALEIQIV